MNIVMMTNTYLPHVGGVARSVETFSRMYRQLGHRVLIVAPQFEGQPARETHVIRVPAIQRFNGSDFSVRLPAPGLLNESLEKFRPAVIHSHHPFLLGDTALRLAASLHVPLVTTHHTMYERYTHYVPGDQPLLQWFVIRLASEYANLCQQVIAPSQTIATTLQQRGVVTPIAVIPTGIDVDRFAAGDRWAWRRHLGIGRGSWVIGHVGRLAPEKNLLFLADAARLFMTRHPTSHLLMVGSGPSRADIDEAMGEYLAPRVHFTGSLTGQDLIDAYHAMDVFAFASQSETQGLVLAEAMAAGRPVVAMDGPGVREVVQDGSNGRLLHHVGSEGFAQALEQVYQSSAAERWHLQQAARATARNFDSLHCARKAVGLYQQVVENWQHASHQQPDQWAHLVRRVEIEWNLWTGRAEAAVEALTQRLALPRS